MFLLELLESVSLDVPLHINCFVLVSNKSTTTCPPYTFLSWWLHLQSLRLQKRLQPNPSKPVVIRIQSLLLVGNFHGDD